MWGISTNILRHFHTGEHTMIRKGILRLITVILAMSFLLIPVMGTVSANAPPEGKFVVVSDTLEVGDKGELLIEKDEWIIFDASSSYDADGAIMEYKWTIETVKDGDSYYLYDEDTGSYIEDVGDRQAVTQKAKFSQEGKWIVTLQARDNGAGGDTQYSEFVQVVEVEERSSTVDFDLASFFISIPSILILLIVVLVLFVGIARGKGTDHFIQGVLVERRGTGDKSSTRKRSRGRSRKKGRGSAKPAKAVAVKRKVAQTAVAQAQTPAGADTGFQPAQDQIDLQPYRERALGWEQQNIDITPLKQVLASAQAGGVPSEEIGTYFANFEGLVNKMRELQNEASVWDKETAFEEDLRQIRIFNNPTNLQELKLMKETLGQKVAQAKAKEEAVGFDSKNCPKCQTEMKVPKTRPVEVRCPNPECRQRCVYKKKGT